MTTVLRVERTEYAGDANLRSRIAHREPFIVTGLVPRWRAFSLWTLPYLGERVGDQRVNVGVSRSRVFSYGTEESPAVPVREMTFREAAEHIANPPEDASEHLYIMEQNRDGAISLPQAYRELADDFILPSVIEPQRLLQINLWVGSRGNVTPLHFDIANNFLAQIIGRKRLTLFDPGQSPSLYPQYSRTNPLNTSRVDLAAPDLARFPEFKKARPVECVLEPGEMLFLPPYWWHQVESLDTAVSINFWWQPHLASCLNPMGLQTIYAAHDAGGLSNAFENADLTGFRDLIDVARYCLGRGHRCAAVLFAKGAVDREYATEQSAAESLVAPWSAILDRAQTGDDALLAGEEVAALLEALGQQMRQPG